jgi:adenine specific DNA methylase Mod
MGINLISENKEKKFFQALRDVFIGAKIEGQGGFVNLMKIKSDYYKKIEVILKKDIDKALERYPNFREELFDKLYSFFSRYFTESGSIYFNSTPFHNNIYEKVYTDDRDVILFWKTRMLYYVKTDKIFRSLDIEIDGFKFYFDVSNLEHKKANEKRDLIYEFKEIKDDKTIVFNVYYSEKGRKTKTDEILKELKKKNIKIDEEIIEKAFRVFEKQSEVDFFINKNAKEFLQEQFKLWSYQYFWEGAREWSSDRVNQLQILKDISFKIIDFISQFEDELVKIWNKPKFVKNSNYVITLDRIKDLKIIEKIIKHKNIDEQIKEWKELGIVDDNFKIKEVIENNSTEKHLNKKYEHLPIDTKYFKDIELEILDLFDDLDKSLDGWLIKSENYQALNTILPKFKEKVQTIYIDPPFNLDSSDQFLYRTNYKDANWATLLENRLRIAKEWLNEKGSIFVRCDYNGNWIVRCLMDEIFGKENFRNELSLRKVNYQGTNVPERFNPAYDLLYFYGNGERIKFNQVFKERGRAVKWVNAISPKENKDANIIEINGRKFTAPKNNHWRFSQDKFNQLNSENRIKIYEEYEYIDVFGNKQKGIPQYLESEMTPLDTNWTDISGYSFGWGFSTENSEPLLKRIIESTSNEDDLVMDFFLGSGTTTAVAHKLGRKWIGVEMGEHFYTVVLPRMKKVLSYDKSGISKEVREYQGGGFFKYYELEQYEETLANAVYEDSGLLDSANKSPYEQYVFLKDEKMLKALEIDYENKKIKIALDKLYKNIDIAETISNLTGKWIKKIKKDEIEFADGTKINPNDLDYKLIKTLIWWE